MKCSTRPADDEHAALRANRCGPPCSCVCEPSTTRPPQVLFRSCSDPYSTAPPEHSPWPPFAASARMCSASRRPPTDHRRTGLPAPIQQRGAWPTRGLSIQPVPLRYGNIEASGLALPASVTGSAEALRSRRDAAPLARGLQRESGRTLVLAPCSRFAQQPRDTGSATVHCNHSAEESEAGYRGREDGERN